MARHIAVRFLQLSDVHLGRSLTGSRLGLPAELAARRRRELLEALAAAFRLVESQRCDGVLLPGDLFDGDDVDDATAAEAFALIGALAPRPVFLAPGNHDPYAPGSPYDAQRWRLLAAGEGPPANLVLFREESFRTVAWPGRDDVTVTGAAFRRPTPVRERRLARPLVEPGGLAPDRAHLLLLHGSRDDAGWLQERKATLPFSAEELARQPFDYAAVGHYHAAAPILHPTSGAILGAYAGSPCFLALDEAHAHVVLVVEVAVEPEPPRRATATVVKHPADPRRLHVVPVDLTGRRDLDQVRAAALEACARAGIGPADVVALRFQGRMSAEISRDAVRGDAAQWLAGGCWHAAALFGAVEPELDASRYLEGEARTLESRFARELLRRIEQEPPGRQREVARAALYYGLEAIVHGRIRRRWEPDAAPAAPAAPAEGDQR